MDWNHTNVIVIGKYPQYLEKLIRALDHLDIPEKNILKFSEIPCTLSNDLSILFAVMHEIDAKEESLDSIKKLLATYPNLIIVHPKSLHLNQLFYDLGVKQSIFLDEMNPYSVQKCLLYASRREKKLIQEHPDFYLNLLQNPDHLGNWEFDLLSKEVSWDETMFKLFRIAPTSGLLPLEIWKSMVHPEDRKKLKALPEQAILDSEVCESGFRINSGGKNTRYFQIKTYVAKDNFKKPIKLVGSIQEISAVAAGNQEKLVNDLKEKKEILNSICTGYCTIDKNWKITDWNRAAGQIMGIKKATAIGKDLRFAFKLNRNEELCEKLCSCIQSMKPANFELYQPLFRKWLDYTIRIKKDRLHIFFRDITSEKEKEIELQALRRLQNDVINSTSGHIWAVDRNLNLMLANDSFFQDMRKISGFPYSIGKKIACQSKSDLSATLKKKWSRAYKKVLDGRRFRMRITATLLNGEQRHYQIVMNPIRSDAQDKEKVTGVACFSSDITSEVKHLKALKAKNRKLEEIAWVHSHLLRAPVTKILGLADILQQSWHSKEELNRLLSYLKEGCLELDEVTRDITAASEKS
ncbi:PAS domain-containing protein [Gramella sp. BOM4]|nr:PAS domain-containing protein [Christiangramia bathymodioli]